MIYKWSGDFFFFCEIHKKRMAKNGKEDTTLQLIQQITGKKKEFGNHILFSLRLKHLYHLSLTCLLSDRGKTPSEPSPTEVRCQL